MERRTTIRFPFSVEALVRHDGRESRGTTLNIGLRGLFVDIPERMPPDTMVEVDLSLDGGGSRRGMKLAGRVVRTTPDGAAIQINETGLDGYIALRDMMMDASRDPGAVMEEFCSFIERHGIS